MSGVELSKISFIDSFKRYKEVFFVLLCLVTGLFLGASLFGDEKIKDLIDEIFNQFILSRNTSNFYLVFLQTALTQMFWLITTFIFGTSIIGIPFIYLLLVFKGVGLALIGCFLYAENALLGVGFYSLIIMPKDVISSLMLISFSKASIEFSKKIFFSKTQNISLKHYFKEYINKLYSMIMVALLASITDATMTYVFIDLFKF